MEVGNLLGQKLQCEGHEKHFLDCQSNYKDISGHNLVRIKSNELSIGVFSKSDIKCGGASYVFRIPYVVTTNNHNKSETLHDDTQLNEPVVDICL